MLDAIGTILVGVALAVILVGIVTTMPLQLAHRLALAGIVGAWVGLAGSVAGAGALSDPVTVLPMFATPLVAVVALALAFPAVRRALNAVPLPLLVGLNAIRIGGVLFVLLADAGRLSGPFPYFAGWGDFTTGALAIPAAWLAASDISFRNRLIVVWNTFGMLDLIVGVTLALISRNGSPLQLLDVGVGSAAMQNLPWAFVPTALVPFFLIAHAAIFVRLRARSVDSGQRPISIGDLGRAH